MDYITEYVTRGGIPIEIHLPLDEMGRFLSAKHLTDSEKRKLTALRLREELEPVIIQVCTLH